MTTNRRLVEIVTDDFYPTPTWATEALIDVEKFTGRILEPACGDGAMSTVLEKTGLQVTSTDLYDHGFEGKGYFKPYVDFLEIKVDKPTFENVITNPPYNIADKFVLKALQTADKKVCMLLRLAYLEGQERFKTIYNVSPPSRVWVFSERITFYKKGVKVKGSGTTAYAWFVWDKEDVSGKTEVKWLAPKYKPKKEKRAKSIKVR